MADRELTAVEQYEAAKAKVAPPISEENNPFLASPNYRPPPPEPAPKAPWQGSILPVATDESGSVSFDPNAGLLGSLKKPFDWAYGVRTGAIPADPRNPAYIGGAAETALTYGPGSAASRVGRGGVQAPPVGRLDEAAEKGFNAYRDSLQMYPASEYRSLLQNTQDQLRQTGFHAVPEGAPVPHRILSAEAERVAQHPFVTSQDLDALRTQLRGQGLRGQNVPANMQAREALFGYIDQNLPPDSGRSVKDAVGNYRQARHSETVTGKEEATSRLNKARAEGPELSAEQTRTNIAKLLNSKAGLKGFSETERNILENANTATPGIDFAQRWGARLTPAKALAAGGLAGGLSSVPALIAGTGAGPALPVAAAVVGGGLAGGAALRSHANRGARRIAEEADNAIRALAPAAREAFPTAPSNFSAMPGGVPRIGSLLPGERAGQVVSGYAASPMLSAAIAERLRSRQQPDPNAPQQYRVLPDGTIEEFM